MQEREAVAALSALAQETRLRIVRLLVRAGPQGVTAGDIGEAVGASSSRVSFHLRELETAGLVQSHRRSRWVIYTASVAGLGALLRFLTADCCQGRPDLCAAALADLEPCCPEPSHA